MHLHAQLQQGIKAARQQQELARQRRTPQDWVQQRDALAQWADSIVSDGNRLKGSRCLIAGFSYVFNHLQKPLGRLRFACIALVRIRSEPLAFWSRNLTWVVEGTGPRGTGMFELDLVPHRDRLILYHCAGTFISLLIFCYSIMNGRCTTASWGLLSH